ncbi:Acyltransferase family protein [compost metagenome]
MKTRAEWIDFLKGLAIVAVVLDHLINVIYFNQTVHLFTIYSVSLFILLSGMTAVISLERNKKPLKTYQISRIKGILIPYIIASVIYRLAYHDFRFNWVDFWNDLLYFKASPPFYFILFFLQLVIIAPYLYKALIKMNVVLQIVGLLPIYFISKYLTHYTEIGSIYGGGGRILGGSYLFVFYLGMLFYLLYQKYGDKLNNLWMYILGIVISLSAIYLIYDSGWLYLAWSNPPNKQAIMYTLFVFVFAFSLYMVASKWKIPTKTLSLFTIMGRHSFYIFLYHLLFIFYASKITTAIGPLNNKLLNAILFLLFAIIIPILIGVIVKYRSVITNVKIFPERGTSKENISG